MKPLRGFSPQLLVLLPLLLTHTAPAQLTLDALAIEVRGASREFAYTNKRAAFLYGETNADNKTGWQGLNLYEDYLAYHPDLLHREIVIHPHVPRLMGEIKASVPFEDDLIELDMNTQSSPRTLLIDAKEVPVEFAVTLRIPAEDGRIVSTRFSIPHAGVPKWN